MQVLVRFLCEEENCEKRQGAREAKLLDSAARSLVSMTQNSEQKQIVSDDLNEISTLSFKLELNNTRSRRSRFGKRIKVSASEVDPYPSTSYPVVPNPVLPSSALMFRCIKPHVIAENP